MDKQVILNAYETLRDTLETVDVNELKKMYSRKELEALQQEIYNVEIRSLAYEIGEAAKEMKLEEFPELLGVHRYPELKEASFLTEEQQVEMDRFLGDLRPNRHYIHGIHLKLKESHNPEKQAALETFLLEKGIAERRHHVECPHCGDSYLSGAINDEEKGKVEEFLRTKEEALESFFMDTVDSGCDECFYEADDPYRLEKLPFKTRLLLVKQADRTLQNL
ncbi:hypothetical protein IMZ31_19070 (plasmid) [Pontibacillus sp. ALD_SL1]|uniref:hypothetical protein n=1 Tax=Pontibacillus sp. ALD_SL1 TaxID=2777185 RepID=UPI001A974EB9|nr:hypothetical protein [Pontibacillus sp. ALD_SL1]QST02652.1 hypothetical protein IMZ31_19070 [Pontibacillus sp. ALD_SL1]